MKKMIWLDEKKNEIIELVDSCTQIEIAEKFNVSTTAISTRLRKWGVSNPDVNRFRRIEINKDELYEMYWNKEMHPSQIAKKYGCSKQVVTDNLIKYNIPRRTKSEARMGKLNPIYGVGHTKEARNKMSEAFKKGRKIGYNTNWGKGAYYETPNQDKVWMRSGWEVKVANYLTEHGVDWYYEHEWLDIGDGRHYLPDFYIKDGNYYIEVKGRVEEEDIIINLLANKKYKVLFWDGIELLKLGIITNCGNTELNRKYRKEIT
jgi:predicted DNA-binding protein YlxM (UPF0122 family)